jgi:hypothetical protein
MISTKGKGRQLVALVQGRVAIQSLHSLLIDICLKCSRRIKWRHLASQRRSMVLVGRLHQPTKLYVIVCVIALKSFVHQLHKGLDSL